MSERIDILISKEQLEAKVDELAEMIKRDYGNKPIHLICVLKGAVIFMVDLARKLHKSVEFDFLDISSYGNGTDSSGVIKINKDLTEPIQGKDVLLIEDIIDSGNTLSYIIEHLKGKKPNSLKICALLDKPDRRVVEGINADYSGFVIPDKFVVGYGIDYAQRHRNLPYIGVVHFEE